MTSLLKSSNHDPRTKKKSTTLNTKLPILPEMSTNNERSVTPTTDDEKIQSSSNDTFNHEKSPDWLIEIYQMLRVHDQRFNDMEVLFNENKILRDALADSELRNKQILLKVELLTTALQNATATSEKAIASPAVPSTAPVTTDEVVPVQGTTASIHAPPDASKAKKHLPNKVAATPGRFVSQNSKEKTA